MNSNEKQMRGRSSIPFKESEFVNFFKNNKINIYNFLIEQYEKLYNMYTKNPAEFVINTQKELFKKQELPIDFAKYKFIPNLNIKNNTKCLNEEYIISNISKLLGFVQGDTFHNLYLPNDNLGQYNIHYILYNNKDTNNKRPLFTVKNYISDILTNNGAPMCSNKSIYEELQKDSTTISFSIKDNNKNHWTAFSLKKKGNEIIIYPIDSLNANYFDIGLEIMEAIEKILGNNYDIKMSSPIPSFVVDSNNSSSIASQINLKFLAEIPFENMKNIAEQDNTINFYSNSKEDKEKIKIVNKNFHYKKKCIDDINEWERKDRARYRFSYPFSQIRQIVQDLDIEQGEIQLNNNNNMEDSHIQIEQKGNTLIRIYLSDNGIWIKNPENKCDLYNIKIILYHDNDIIQINGYECKKGISLRNIVYNDLVYKLVEGESFVFKNRLEVLEYIKKNINNSSRIRLNNSILQSVSVYDSYIKPLNNTTISNNRKYFADRLLSLKCRQSDINQFNKMRLLKDKTNVNYFPSIVKNDRKVQDNNKQFKIKREPAHIFKKTSNNFNINNKRIQLVNSLKSKNNINNNYKNLKNNNFFIKRGLSKKQDHEEIPCKIIKDSSNTINNKRESNNINNNNHLAFANYSKLNVNQRENNYFNSNNFNSTANFNKKQDLNYGTIRNNKLENLSNVNEIVQNVNANIKNNFNRDSQIFNSSNASYDSNQQENMNINNFNSTAHFNEKQNQINNTNAINNNYYYTNMIQNHSPTFVNNKSMGQVINGY